MFFTFVPLSQSAPVGSRSRAFLHEDRWDDWGKFRTMFSLVVVDASGASHHIGSVKIGHTGLRSASTISPGHRAPQLPLAFDSLAENFFSLGQSEDYYAELSALPDELGTRVLEGLRDCAFDSQIYAENAAEEVMTESLLREIRAENVTGRLHRLANGDAQLTEFRFSYAFAQAAAVPPATVDFSVLPESQPPTNVHVLIGRNGVGKTRCMVQLTEALLGRQSIYGGAPGTIQLESVGGQAWNFAGLVLVSFSAFDAFDPTPLPTDRLGIHLVGVHHRSSSSANSAANQPQPRSPAVLFRESLERCGLGVKAVRWRAAVATLEVDDLFAEADVTSLLDIPRDDDWPARAEHLFNLLSSGHKIILLTVTRLVELVDEKTLVLLDEPEGHLHPPLLAAFIRCLSDLLVKRNGVAIIATHSPVVLQEVPRNCAWKLRRSGAVAIAERPTLETFGENIGALTREVFGLDVTRSGYHQLLNEAVARGLTFTAIVSEFNGQLGEEAKAIVQALVAERDEI